MFERKRLGVLASILLAAVSLSAQNNASAPAAAAKPEAPVNAPPEGNGAPAAVDPKAYLIGPEDYIKVFVWHADDFSGVHWVRPDGMITLPGVGDVHAEGLTPNRLDATLTEALSVYVESPDVTVSVMQVNSKSYRVSGWVNRPAKYPLITPIRVYEAIMDAGGFREYANLKKIIIFRGAQRIEFNANDYRKAKNLEKNIWVEHGDIIEVTD